MDMAGRAVYFHTNHFVAAFWRSPFNFAQSAIATGFTTRRVGQEVRSIGRLRSTLFNPSGLGREAWEPTRDRYDCARGDVGRAVGL
jgi:hypothetical protein